MSEAETEGEEPTNSLGLHNVPPAESAGASTPREHRGRPGTSSRRRPTLAQTAHDLRTLLTTISAFVPSALLRALRIVGYPLRRFAAALLHASAMVLHRRGQLASGLVYDLLVLFWKALVNIFFREIRSRGAWKVPKDGEGAIIFVVAPHNNQVRLLDFPRA